MASSSQSLSHHLALIDEEVLVHDFDGVSPGPNLSSESYYLVVKIFTQKVLKPDWLDKAMREAWTLPLQEMSLLPVHFRAGKTHFAKCVGKITITSAVANCVGKSDISCSVRFPINFSEYHSGLFLAHFGCDRDRRRVIEGQPLHFDHCLMVFANPEDPLTLLSLLLKMLVLTFIKLLCLKFWVPSFEFVCYSTLPSLFVEACMFSLGSWGRVPPVLPFKDNIRAPPKSFFKRDPFDMANSIPFEEMNLRSYHQNHDLTDVVNQFLPTTGLACANGSEVVVSTDDFDQIVPVSVVEQSRLEK
uniref:Uncharacterized protein n=1 Tax=Cannabis sativa TaxID=3483 RepID=A0A803P2A2_CANSA